MEHIFNALAGGVYNIQNHSGLVTLSSDIVWDGELILSNNGSGSSDLFTGSRSQAQSIDTMGWNIRVKNIKVSDRDVTFPALLLMQIVHSILSCWLTITVIVTQIHILIQR